jgi:FADH2 O2-dependent halogenase
MTRRECDILVIGAGFAGSLCATILRTLGWDVLLVERGRHPRFAIGESSTPLGDAALKRICQRYGLHELLPLAAYGTWKAACPNVRRGLKRGFTYFWHDEGREHRPSPDHCHEYAVAASSDDESSDTHWLRADVDAYFCDVAQQRGVEYWDQCHLAVQNQSSDSWQFSATMPDRQVDVIARFVIDGSGTEGVVPKALGIADATHTMATHSSAILGHFEQLTRWRELLEENGALLDDYPFDPDAAAVHQVYRGGWMWQLRFDHEVVSAGFAYSPKAAVPPPGLSTTEEFAWRCGLSPSLARQFARAKCIAPQAVPVRLGRLQRLWSQAAGSNWLLLPFTAGFIDPLQSTGIAHAMSTIERLGLLFGEGPGQWPSEMSLKEYGRNLVSELRLIDQIVAACFAGMTDFRLFILASMLYFAGATFAETSTETGNPRGFLCSENQNFTLFVAEALARLQGLSNVGKPLTSDIASFEAWMKGAIAPFNRVGLFAPAKPNMYAYTATKPPLRSSGI